MNQIYGICNLSLVPLRAEPADKSEMISQLLFGDHFLVLEQTEKWVRIQTAYDDYQGWMDIKQFLPVKYDIYDPNRHVSGNEIGAVGSNTHAGDVKFNTFGVGYIYFSDSHIKIVLWYDFIKNEKTLIDGFTSDIKDNIFTFRIQYRF